MAKPEEWVALKLLKYKTNVQKKKKMRNHLLKICSQLRPVAQPSP